MSWYFSVDVLGGTEIHEEDGYPSEVAAMQAAEGWCYRRWGFDPPTKRITMAVSRSDNDNAPRFTAYWPNFHVSLKDGGVTRGIWQCEQAVDDETAKRLTR